MPVENPLFNPTTGIIGGVGMAGAAIAAFFAIIFALCVFIMPRGAKEIRQIGNAISRGAIAFILMEYMSLAGFMLVLFVVVSAAVNWQSGICFLVGTTASATAGAVGMLIATQANMRTTTAAKGSMLFALRTAFSSGAVLGLSTVAVGLGGISFFLLIFGESAIGPQPYLAGFGLGCTVVSLFARVGGGIFTKAADVGADLVGKVEKGLPEDDIRNPACIADNVGDNVGDVAGMSADLCGSFVGSTIASCILGFEEWGLRGAGFAIWLGVFGVVSSIIGHFSVWCRKDAKHFEVLLALRTGLFVSNFIQIGFMALITYLMSMPWKFFGVAIIGMACGFFISLSSETFTSPKFYFTRSISQAGHLGAASVIIQGLAVGMYSLMSPAFLVAGTLIGCILLGDVYGACIASTAMLSTLAFTLTMDAMGAVSDNAGGIAEMTHQPEYVRARTDTLDSIGNTTAAVGKGFATGAALLAGYALINIYKTRIGIALNGWDAASNPWAVSGVLLGAMLPYMFSAMTMQAVSVCAETVILEVRRQLKAYPEILCHERRADHAKCVLKVTASSIHAMFGPSFIIVLVPVVSGILLPPQFLLGLLLANTVSGFCLSTVMSNAGGSWDNAKKYVEEGNLGGKNSTTHKATVVGDTVGDPFKDTSGPGINISIKLSNYMGIVLAPAFAQRASFWWSGFIILFVSLLLLVPIVIASPTRIMRLMAKMRGDLSKAATKDEEPSEASTKKSRDEALSVGSEKTDKVFDIELQEQQHSPEKEQGHSQAFETSVSITLEEDAKSIENDHVTNTSLEEDVESIENDHVTNNSIDQQEERNEDASL